MTCKYILMASLLASALPACDQQKVIPPKVEYKKTPEGPAKVTLTISNSPADLNIERIEANYLIANRECIPIDETIAIGGIRPNFREEIPLELRKIGKRNYETNLSTRPIKSADYFGLGVCNWKLAAIDVKMNAGHDLAAGVSASRLQSGRQTTLFCSRYDNTEAAVDGCLYRSDLVSDDLRSYFSVTFNHIKE